MLAVARIVQQFIDQIFPSLGGIVFQEGFDFLRRGRQADEIEIQPSDQGHPVRLGSGFHALLGQAMIDEAVNRIRGPLVALVLGEQRVFRPAETPTIFYRFR